MRLFDGSCRIEYVEETPLSVESRTMKVQQGRALQAFRRVQAWFVEHPDVLANSGSSKDALAKQLDALTQVVDAMTAGATEQTTQKSQATLAAKDEKSLRADVRSLHLKSIVNVAQGLRGKVPGMGCSSSRLARCNPRTSYTPRRHYARLPASTRMYSWNTDCRPISSTSSMGPSRR